MIRHYRNNTPMLWFGVRLHYATPGGCRQQVHYKLPAIAADLALEKAERLLRRDRRRRIGSIDYGEAVQL